MTNKNKKSYRELNALLDSDDELPNSYSEVADIPAYQIDYRFNSDVKFEWLKKYHNQNVKDPLRNQSVDSQMKPWSAKSDKEIFYNGLKDNFPVKGVLFNTDVFCLSQIAQHMNETLLLWFYKFLIYRDMQADFKFLKSCLIDSNFPKFSNETNSGTSLKNKMGKKFKVVIL